MGAGVGRSSRGHEARLTPAGAADRDVVVSDDAIAIRRMRDDDYDYRLMVGWRNRAHVRRWWDPDEPPLDLATAREEYRPDTLPDAASTACFIERDGVPVGFIQFYRWSSYAEEAREVGVPFDEGTWGVDIFIGEESETGRGVGTRAMQLLGRHLHSAHGASAVALTVDVDNDVAIRSYRKAGFERIKKVLDTDTRGGERVTAWLMVRRFEQ
ncbi:MAG: acetyltransferase [Actinomycetota bacterium]|nr:acetyltransferase [Actinomycetota bacterium]